MSIRILACLLLIVAAGAQAAAPAKKKAEAAPPPQEIDVDAMARAKDVDAQAVPPADSAAADAAEAPPAAASDTPSPTDAPADAPKHESAPAEKPAGATQDALALTPPIDPQEKRVAAGCEARSASLLDAAQKGDFEAAGKDFDAKMRGALPPAKFKETWSSLAQFGALQARGQSHPSKGEGYYLVMTPLIFDKANLVAQVACGSDGRIAGFHVKPLSALQQ